MARRPRISTLVFVGALALSMGAATTVHVVERNSARVEFEADARELHQRLEARLDALVALLRGAAGLHATLGVAPDEVFRTYIARLDLERNYPGVLGIGFAHLVPVADVEAFETEARRVLPGFTVHPSPSEDAWIIRMLEPLTVRNEVALGFDMGSQPTRRAAMERAVDKGDPTLSGRVTLVQEITPDKQAGFLVYVPVYEGGIVPTTREARREQATGVSYAPLRAGDFFAPLATGSSVGFAVYAGPDDLLYRSEPSPGGWEVLLPLTVPASDWVVLYDRAKPDTSRSVLTVGGLGVLLSLGLYVASATAERRERERMRRHARDAAVARAMASMYDAPRAEGMVERLAAWLVDEEHATRVEGRFPSGRVVARGAPVEGAFIEHEVAGIAIRVRPASADCAELISGVLERAGWVVERALLHEQAREALARNETALKFANLFVGVLGHDLRNPLNAIGTAAQVLERFEHPPPAQEVIRRMRSSVDRMSRLIDQILDFTRARIGGGIPIRPMPSDVRELAMDIVAETRIAVPDRTLSLSCTGDTRAVIDPDRLAQALSNLLGNAVQHGQGDRIDVIVDGTAPEAVQVRICNGGVVPPEILPLVFEPFRSGASAEGRLGLGMYIARMIVEAHGGAIAMDSNPETGTVARIVLPRRASAADRLPAATTSS